MALLLVALVVSAVVAAVNVPIIRARASGYIARDPALAEGYSKVQTGLVVLSIAPWLIAIAVFALFRPPLMMCIWIGAVVTWIPVMYWIIWRGGAEFLVQHQGILINTPTNPLWMKWLAVVVPLVVTAGLLVAY